MYDVGNDLAEAITESAEGTAKAHLEELNRHAREANDEARRITADAFRDCAARLRVTNPYLNGESLRAPLEEFFNTVQPLVFLKLEGQDIAFPDGMSHAQRQAESAFDARIRTARAQFERSIRAQIEAPPAGVPPRPAF